MIVDGNSILNRAFYGLKGPAMLSTAEGLYTNAVYGFINILNKYLEEEKPDYLGVAFDLKAKTFRHHLYDGYKATRKGMPDELAMQLPLIKDVLKAMNIPIIEKEGLEADDILGIYSKLAEDNGLDVAILTGDRDSLQLVSEQTNVIIPSTSKGKTETTKYSVQTVLEKYGLEPKALIDVKALMGDTSDNIPGVKGVGEKTAIELIKIYGSIDSLYEHLEDISREKLRTILANDKELAYMSRNLGTIIREFEGFSDVGFLKRREADREVLLELYKRLEFSSLIKKLGQDSAKPSGEPEKVEAACEISQISNLITLDTLVGALVEKEKINLYPLIEKTDRIGGNLQALAIHSGCDSYFIPVCEELSETQIVHSLTRLFLNENLLIVTPDVKALYVWLLSYDLDIACKAFDLMIAEYLIDAQATSYSLDRLALKYPKVDLEVPEPVLGKGKQKIADLAPGILKDFMMKAIGLFDGIFGEQVSILEQSGQHELFYNVEVPLALVLGSMEYVGFKVDQNYLDDFRIMLDKRIQSVEQSIFILAGESFNVNSPKQLGVILFERLGLKSGRKTKTGYSTDAEVLEELSDAHDIIPMILEFRQLVKLKSTYAEGLVKAIHPKTGRIHSSFNQTVAATGRISSTEPNLQNIPIRTELGREIRKAFIPQAGYTLADADYSQIELRVLAHITNDVMLTKAFVEGVDIHTLTASQVFKVSTSEVTSEMRRRAKAVNFGIVYGIGDFSLARDIHVTKKEAALYIENYLATYPGVKIYMDETVEQGLEHGYVKTMFNRIRYIPELKSSNFQVRSFGKRVAMNTPIQGSAADIIKIAMVKVWDELKQRKLKSRLILQVHDELLVETWEDELDAVKDIIKRNMEEAVTLSVPLIADVSTGQNWYEAK